MKTKRSIKKKLVRSGLLSTCLLVPAGMTRFATPAFGQVVNGTISGTVQDNTGAVIPNATVTLTNQATGDKRSSTSNGSGVFSFAGLPSGDFTVVISAAGFTNFSEKGVHLDPGDSRDLPNLRLSTGGTETVVNVEGEGSIPLDTGEKSDLITSEEIKHLAVEGRDVSELFKTLPGFAIASNGNVSNTAYDPSQVTVGGAAGSYSANGSIQGINIHLDGANLTDPGNYGGTLQNINYDQISEVKIQTSNFGADVDSGPIVVSAVTKSGTDHFHGTLYTYARTSQLDSSDALNGVTGQAKDPDHEIYPGFTVGGPVLIPGTSFNKNRALTFFAGAEDYAQRNIYAYGNSSAALVHALVPTAAMRGGDFSQGALQTYLGGLYNNSSYQNVSVVPTVAKDGTPLVNGQLPSKYIDPAFAYLANTFPLPNNTPTVANPYNYQGVDYVNNDLWQVIGRVDLSISQRNHFFGRYSTERGAAGEPAAVYYNPNGINTPGGGLESTNSQSMASNLTTIITPTLTNQLFANLIYLDQAFKSPNPALLSNYPYQGAYANGRHPLPEIQAYNAGQGGLPLAINPDYSLSPEYSRKLDPEGGDNVTKVWGKHTASFGVYGQRSTNNQVANNQNTNGAISNYGLPGAGQPLTDIDGSLATMSGNLSTDDFEGYVGGYTQQNILPKVNLYYWDLAFFANDSWRVTNKLTVVLGGRFEHDGLWNDNHGLGIAVFNPALITSPTPTSPFPGFLWHAIDPSIPNSGTNSYPLFVEPRLGFAFDAFGNGKTVIRGGFGEYRGHDSWNNTDAAVGITQNVQSVTEPNASLAAISRLNINPNPALTNSAKFTTTGTENATTLGDREQPLSDTYSLTLNQALPSHTLLTMSYVGDNNRFLINGGSTQPVVLDNVNAIPIGGLYKPNPITGQVLAPFGLNPPNYNPNAALTTASASTLQINQYRPLNTPNVQYGPIDVTNHNLYSNYNGVQVGVARQTGRILFNVNYTFSKALGVRGAGADDGNGYPTTPFGIQNNYGTENFDRRHILNATYTFEVGNPVKNRFLGQVTNGWELSGITTYQSGADIIALNQPNLALSGQIGPSNLPGVTPTTANPNAITVSNNVYLGTPDVDLQPTVTCNPRSGLAAGQYINGNCFGLPNFLQNGPSILPRLPGPGFLDTDLSAQKNFTIHDQQTVQIRAAAFNFVNHPLNTLTGAFPNQYQLNYTLPNATGFAQNASNSVNGFGSFPDKTGRRIMELSLKYNF